MFNDTQPGGPKSKTDAAIQADESFPQPDEVIPSVETLDESSGSKAEQLSIKPDSPMGPETVMSSTALMKQRGPPTESVEDVPFSPTRSNPSTPSVHEPNLKTAEPDSLAKKLLAKQEQFRAALVTRRLLTAPKAQPVATEIPQSVTHTDPLIERPLDELAKHMRFAELKDIYESRKWDKRLTENEERAFLAREEQEFCLNGKEKRHAKDGDIEINDSSKEQSDDVEDPESLFVPQSSHSRRTSDNHKDNLKLKRKRSARVSAVEVNHDETIEDDENGSEEGEQEPRLQRVPKRSRKVPIGKVRAHSRTKQALEIGNVNNSSVIGNLFNNDPFLATAATAHLRSQPSFGHQSKRADMLKEVVANLPKDEQKDASHDRRALNDSVTYLNGRENNTGIHTVKGTNEAAGAWILKGVKTPLKSYQIMGVAFMRQRENSKIEPRGGLLCDSMGLGKTLQCLATIVNGKPPADSTAKATLIVASPALIAQWQREIEIHCYKENDNKGLGVGDVMAYHAGCRPNHSDLKGMLSKACIVLTTYHEVSKSYPKAVLPPDLVTTQEKDEWWTNEYATHRGILHQIEWYRVCLDEAACIKNHQSHTSMACRALQYRHAWAITGTPVMNNLGEFYALFKFLRCPETTTYKVFKENFERDMDPEGVEKLCYFLEEYMIRRTHADTLFNARLLDLPTPEEKTVWIKFTPVERQIYSIVQERMIEKINTIAAHEVIDTDKSNSHVWTLIIRLRQMCSHILLIQETVVDVLDRADYQKLNRLAQCGYATGPGGKVLLDHLREVLKISIAAKAQSDAELNEANLEIAAARNAWKFSYGKSYDDLRRQEELKRMKQLSICVKCHQTAKDARVTSCQHTYCFRCLDKILHAVARRGHESGDCIECGQNFGSTDLIKATDGPAAPDKSVAPPETSRLGEIAKKLVAGGTKAWISKLKGEVLYSAKTRAARQQIKEWFEEDATCKIIVYAQFLDIIRIMGRVCEMEGWAHICYTGTMSHAARARAITDFESSPLKRILLASLKCGGIGLNLTMASRVLNLDPWFNLAIENQAFCRVFRIGQTKPTRMTRLVVEDSVDSAMHALKERKQVDIDAVMDMRGQARYSIRELMKLLGDVREDGQGKPFIVKGSLALSALGRG